MKSKIQFRILLVAMLAVLISSCQKESQEYINDTPDETITANSVLARNLVSAAQNNGSVDDIIDGSSCISVLLPVDILANGQPLSINTLSDLQTIQLIFNQDPNDIDSVTIVFPITVIFEDYSEIIVTDQAQLDSVISECVSFIEDTYRCVDFVYPISCFTFNTANEQTGIVTVNNNHEWFDYLNYLTEEILISIDYGMTMIVNGESFAVNSNQEVENVLAQADCSVTIGGSIDPEVVALREIMKDGTWYVEQFLDDGDDETSDFNGYDFNFLETVTVYASNGSQNIYGIWIVTIENNQLNFEFDMDSPINGADDDDYEVLISSESSITFVTRDSDGTIEDTLTFSKN